MSVFAKPEQKQAPKDTAQTKAAEGGRKPSNLTGIPDGMKMQFENLSGLSLDDVRVHYDSGKPAQLQALAYTQGSQVYMGPGQEKHLRHELGHVIQQKQGSVRRTTVVNGVPVNDDPTLESEAERGVVHRRPEAGSLTTGTTQLAPRSANPYGLPGQLGGLELTAHHIIPHSLLLEALGALPEEKQEEIVCASIPDKLTNDMLVNLSILKEKKMMILKNNRQSEQMTNRL